MNIPAESRGMTGKSNHLCSGLLINFLSSTVRQSSSPTSRRCRMSNSRKIRLAVGNAASGAARTAGHGPNLVSPAKFDVHPVSDSCRGRGGALIPNLARNMYLVFRGLSFCLCIQILRYSQFPEFASTFKNDDTTSPRSRHHFHRLSFAIFEQSLTSC